MEIKQEFVVFGYRAQLSHDYYYRFEKQSRTDGYHWSWRGFIPYADDNMFPTKAQALAFADEVAKGSSKFYENPIIIESSHDNCIHTAWEKANYGRYIIFVIQVPVSYYIGNVWSRTLSEIGNDKYTDNKPCQVYRRGYEGLTDFKLYLKREQGKADEWVRDKWQGSFFAPKEANKIADKFCQAVYKGLPNGFWAWTTMELIRPAEGQKPDLEKGDEVFTLPDECWPCSYVRRGCRHTITDIKVEMDAEGNKEFVYEVTDVSNFLPRHLLFTREQIKADGGKFRQGRFNGRVENLLDYKGWTYTAY